MLAEQVPVVHFIERKQDNFSKFKESNIFFQFTRIPYFTPPHFFLEEDFWIFIQNLKKNHSPLQNLQRISLIQLLESDFLYKRNEFICDFLSKIYKEFPLLAFQCVAPQTTIPSPTQSPTHTPHPHAHTLPHRTIVNKVYILTIITNFFIER